LVITVAFAIAIMRPGGSLGMRGSMEILIICAAAWCLMSLPVGVALGRWCRHATVALPECPPDARELCAPEVASDAAALASR
jgi:hypothetical protein